MLLALSPVLSGVLLEIQCRKKPGDWKAYGLAVDMTAFFELFKFRSTERKIGFTESCCPDQRTWRIQRLREPDGWQILLSAEQSQFRLQNGAPSSQRQLPSQRVKPSKK